MSRPGPAFHASLPWYRAAVVVAGTDLRIERRTGDATVASLLFGALVLVLCAFLWSAVGTEPAAGAAAAYWIAAGLSAHLALVRSWTRERDDDAIDALRLAPIPRAAILLGKAAALGAVLLVVQAALVLPTLLLFSPPVSPSAAYALLAVLLADAGIAVVGSLFGAMILGGTGADLLVGAAVYPLLLPLFLAAAEISRAALNGLPPTDVAGWFAVLLALDLALGAAALWSFGPVLEE